MKKITLLSVCSLLTILITFGGMQYQYIRLKKIATKETSLRQHSEWTTFYGINNIGKSVPSDIARTGRNFLLRYDSSTCLTCITKAEELLYEVFGEEYLTKELCCIGVPGQVKPPKNIHFVQSQERITPTDDIYTPYLCIINDNGNVLFTLSLIPDMYNYNRAILLRLKKVWINLEEKSTEAHTYSSY